MDVNPFKGITTDEFTVEVLVKALWYPPETTYICSR